MFGRNKEEHDSRLTAVLKRIQAAGVTLNKCEFAKTKLIFLGHIVDHQGIQADPEKTAVIKEMSRPEYVSGRFLGMIKQMGKFLCNLAQLTQPLWELEQE